MWSLILRPGQSYHLEITQPIQLTNVSVRPTPLPGQEPVLTRLEHSSATKSLETKEAFSRLPLG